MFSRIFSACKNFFSGITASLHSLFKRSSIDESALDELRTLLLHADTGPRTTNLIVEKVKNSLHTESSGSDLRQQLHLVLKDMLTGATPAEQPGEVILLIGINGSGKTTTAAKVASMFTEQGKRVLLVAADTFRAAAVAQLAIWAKQLKIELITGTVSQDPASVVFAACTRWKEGHFDTMIIDTAGRMHTKQHLMDELGKVRRTLAKQLPATTVTTLLTIDSMLGQNSLEQARLFHQNTHMSGLILTKCDGTGKGGIVLSIFDELKVPIWYITTGEKLTDIHTFATEEFINTLMGA